MSLDLKSSAALFLFAGFVVACAHGEDAAAKQRLLEIALHENLTPGSSVQEVENFLSNFNLEHSYISEEHKVVAIDRDVQSTAMVSTSIQVECRFDAAEKLRNCVTNLVATGP